MYVVGTKNLGVTLDQWITINTTSVNMITTMIKNIAVEEKVFTLSVKIGLKEPINLKHTCPFYFYVAFDSKGFYVVPGLGIKNHLYHNQQDQSKCADVFESRRQLSEKNVKLVADMGRGKLSATQIQSAVFQSSGNLLSLSTINSITDYYNNGIIKDYEFDGVFEGRGSGVNCTEYMMKYCNGNKYNFMLLLNDPFISSDPISEVFSLVHILNQYHTQLLTLTKKKWNR